MYDDDDGDSKRAVVIVIFRQRTKALGTGARSLRQGTIGFARLTAVWWRIVRVSVCVHID